MNPKVKISLVKYNYVFDIYYSNSAFQYVRPSIELTEIQYIETFEYKFLLWKNIKRCEEDGVCE